MIGTLFGGSRQEKVLRLLDEERAVILRGPLADLAPLVARREIEIEEIFAGESPDQAFLAAVRARAERNGRLLRASLAGARAAVETVEKARRAAQRLRTYSPEGQPIELGAPRITRDQRA